MILLLIFLTSLTSNVRADGDAGTIGGNGRRIDFKDANFSVGYLGSFSQNIRKFNELSDSKSLGMSPLESEIEIEVLLISQNISLENWTSKNLPKIGFKSVSILNGKTALVAENQNFTENTLNPRWKSVFYLLNPCKKGQIIRIFYSRPWILNQRKELDDALKQFSCLTNQQ